MNNFQPRRIVAFAILVITLATLACSAMSSPDMPATETAIAAQVMTQLAPTDSHTPPASATPLPPTAPPQLPQSDFAPCSGYSATSPDGLPHTNYGPWATRLLIAFSDDGLTFTRANQILADQADVPDAVTTDDGEIRVYFIIMCPEEVRNTIVVAVSRDGAQWVYKKTSLVGADHLIPMAVDPTIERALDGRWRLYFTSAPREASFESAQTYSAISDDGVNFVVEDGVRFAPATGQALDPTVLLIGDTWHYFAGGVPGSNHHATSADGLNFTTVDDFGMEDILMANGLAVDGGYRYYGFVQPRDNKSYLRSLFTTDGVTWTVDVGTRLTLDESTDLEAVGLKDPAVTRLPDGRYLMIYVAIIPGFPTQQPNAPGPRGSTAMPLPSGLPPINLTQLPAVLATP